MHKYLSIAIFVSIIFAFAAVSQAQPKIKQGETNMAENTSGGMWESTKNVTSDVWKGTKTVTEDVWDGAKKVTVDVYDGAKKIGSDIGDAVSDEDKKIKTDKEHLRKNH